VWRAMARSGGRRGIYWLAASLAAFAAAPAGASGVISVMDAYNDVTPATARTTLLPMSFPPGLGPIGQIEVEPGAEPRGHYGLLFNHVIPAKHPGGFPTTDANLIVHGYGKTPLAKEARIAKALYHVASTTVRGHSGVLIKGKHKPTVGLIWSEGGQLYSVGTGTPKTVPLADLQRTAAGLDRVTGQLKGETPPETGFSATGFGIQAHVVIGEHAAVIETGWAGECQPPTVGESPPWGGAKTTLALPLAGAAVAFGPAPVTLEELARGETAAWTLSVAGSVAPAGGQLTERAAGTSDGRACAIGPQTFPLAPSHGP
jgi:hypothetical protein